MKRRYALSISSWFCIPDQGMKDLEMLSRASAFLVKAKNRLHDFGQKKTMSDERKIKYLSLKDSAYHIVTSSHVIAPWRYPKYYSQEFIKYVNETHTYYTIELRNEDGTFITQTELIPRSFHHSERDVAILHMDDESNAMKTLESLELQTLELLDNSVNLRAGDNLIFHGHDVRGGDEFNNYNSDDRKPYPCTVNGHYYYKTISQSFSKTEPVLTDGMCGGPVLYSNNGDKSKVCGMVEGIVPTNHPDDGLKGLAVFIDSKIITKFIDDVEQGIVEPLYGGDIAITVGSDQDSSKMNFDKILEDDSKNP